MRPGSQPSQYATARRQDAGVAPGVPDIRHLRRPRLEADLADLVVLPFMCEMLAAPRLAHDRDLLLDEFIALPLANPQGIELDLKIAQSHGEQQPVAAHVLERVDHQRAEQGMAMGNQRSEPELDLDVTAPMTASAMKGSINVLSVPSMP